MQYNDKEKNKKKKKKYIMIIKKFLTDINAHYIIEQQTVLFYRRILRGFYVVPRSLLHQSPSLLSKFKIQSLSFVFIDFC